MLREHPEIVLLLLNRMGRHNYDNTFIASHSNALGQCPKQIPPKIPTERKCFRLGPLGNPPQILVLLNLFNLAVAIGLIERNPNLVVPLLDILEQVFHILDAKDLRVDM